MPSWLGTTANAPTRAGAVKAPPLQTFLDGMELYTAVCLMKILWRKGGNDDVDSEVP